MVKAMNVNVADTKTEIIDKNFSDGNTVSPGNEKYIAYAIETNLVVGYDGKLNLNKGITRAETACLLHRAINMVK